MRKESYLSNFFSTLKRKNFTTNTIHKYFIGGVNNVDSLCDDDKFIYFMSVILIKSEKSLDTCLNFNNIETPVPSPWQKSNGDLPLDISGLFISLDSMPLKKSPGNDAHDDFQILLTIKAGSKCTKEKPN